MSKLRFNVLSGGYAEIVTELCRECDSKACAISSEGKPVCDTLKIKEGLPFIPIGNRENILKECTECLACELKCRSMGKAALKFYFPMPEMDALRSRNEKRI